MKREYGQGAYHRCGRVYNGLEGFGSITVAYAHAQIFVNRVVISNQMTEVQIEF